MSADKFFSMFADAARERETESASLYDMFTWLPSYKAAEIHFGDYASDVCFHRNDTIQEATKVLSVLSGYNISKAEALEWFYVNEETFWDRSNEDNELEIPSEEDRLAFIRDYFKTQFNHDIDIADK